MPHPVTAAFLAALGLTGTSAALAPAQAYGQSGRDTQDQPAAEPDAPGAGARVFGQDFFAQDRPATALDMVNRVPGFTIDAGTGGRGLGASVGNVLIDGVRPSSKDQSLESLLQQIPAASVERIELLSGRDVDADLTVHDAVVNVIRRRDAGVSSTVRANATGYANGFVAPFLTLSHARPLGGLQLEATLEGGREGYLRADGTERLLGPAGGLLDSGNSVEGFQGDRLAARMAANGQVAGVRTSITSLANQTRFTRRFWLVSRSAGSAGQVRTEAVTDSFDTDQAELAVTLNRDLAGWDMRLALLGKSRSETGDGLGTFAAAPDPGFAYRFAFTSRTTEAAASLSGTRRWSAITLSLGTEFARNRLDSTSRIETGLPGRLQPDPSGASQTDVREDRVESNLDLTWALSPALTLESGLAGEWSTITQTGSGGKTRDFFYPKPRLTVAWTPAPGVTVRARLEQAVGQLSFGDFAQSASVGDGTLTAGNPDLRPEQTRTAELSAERRWGERGFVSLSLVHEDIEDVLVLAPLRPAGGGAPVGEALLNLPEATRWGFDLNATVPLPRGFEAELRWRWRDTRHIDPVERTELPLAGWPNRELRPAVMQRLPNLRLEWGAWYLHRTRVVDRRLGQTFTFRDPASWGTWVRWSPTGRLNLEAGWNSPLESEATRVRADFAPDRSARPPVLTQVRTQQLDPTAYATVTLTF